MMKPLKLALLLGVAFGASATDVMARESSKGLYAAERDAIVRQLDTRAIVQPQWDQLARRGEKPRGEDNEDNDIGDDHGADHGAAPLDQLARRGEKPRGEDNEDNDIGDDHGTDA